MAEHPPTVGQEQNLGKAFVQAFLTDEMTESLVTARKQAKTLLEMASTNPAVLALIRIAAKEKVGFSQALEIYEQGLRDEIGRDRREYCDKWEQDYGEPYPEDLGAWLRLAVRAGVPAEKVWGGKWKLREVAPIVEGYLLRLKDATHHGAGSTGSDENGDFVWFTSTEAGNYVGVSQKTITNWIREGLITVYESKGNSYQLLLAELDAKKAARRKSSKEKSS